MTRVQPKAMPNWCLQPRSTPMDERVCVKCGKAHLAAPWYVRQVRDVASKQITAQYLCGEAHGHLSPLAQARWTRLDAQEGRIVPPRGPKPSPYRGSRANEA